MTIDVFCLRYPEDERCVTEQTCEDPNRDTNNDGSCADNCNTGFDQPEGYDVCTSIEQLCSDGANGYGPENELCVTEPEECAKPDGTLTGATTESGCEECPEGQSFDVNGICVTGPLECANGATTESGCEECPEGQRFDFNGICVTDAGFTCDDYNRTTNEDGTCGPCKEGYETDTSLPNEPCVKIFDGCSAGFELVNGECTAIVCPEGQSYCIDTDGCVDIGTCPSDPPEEGGGSGGGGGGSGGSGMFAIEPTTVTADAQLLSRPEFPITDYLAGLFTNSTGGSA